MADQRPSKPGPSNPKRSRISDDRRVYTDDELLRILKGEDSDFNFNSSDKETDSDTERDVGEEEALNVTILYQMRTLYGKLIHLE